VRDASGRLLVPGDIVYEAPKGPWNFPHNSLFPLVFVRPEVPPFCRPQDARSGWFGRPGEQRGTDMLGFHNGESVYPTKAEAVWASLSNYADLVCDYAAWLAVLEAEAPVPNVPLLDPDILEELMKLGHRISKTRRPSGLQ